MKKAIYVKIDEDVYNEFIEFCEEKGYTKTQAIENIIKDRIEMFRKEMKFLKEKNFRE